MGEWQPIETAPLDGTEVILRFVTLDESVEVLNGWYDGTWRRICNNLNTYQYLCLGCVTHWMPLPKPSFE